MILLNDFAKFASLRAVIELPQLFIIALNYKIGQALIQLLQFNSINSLFQVDFSRSLSFSIVVGKKMRGIRTWLVNIHMIWKRK